MKVGVVGAGAIGCYVGGCLSLKLTPGQDQVVLVGRTSLLNAVKQSDGHLLLESCVPKQEKLLINANGGKIKLGEYVVATDDYSALEGCDVVLLSVKSQHTKETAQRLAKYISSNCIIVSLQNGASNPKAIKEVLPENEVLGGMVGFNVIWRSEGASFRMSTGKTIPLLLI